MTNDKEAVNRFLNRLQDSGAESAETMPPPSKDDAQRVVINRPVRCTFYFGTPPAPGVINSKRAKR